MKLSEKLAEEVAEAISFVLGAAFVLAACYALVALISEFARLIR